MPADVIDQLHIMLYIWFALLGLIVGLLIALLCGRLDRGKAGRSTTEREDSEQEVVPMETSGPGGMIDWIELPSGAQVCCLQSPKRRIKTPACSAALQAYPSKPKWSSGNALGEPDPTPRVENGGNFAENGRDSQKNGRKQRHWVEQGVSAGRVTPLSTKERNFFS